MSAPDDHIDDAQRNRETVASYGRYAATYAAATRQMSPVGRQMLERFRGAVPPGALVLEIGSGPGWDADYLEASGLAVRRTDASDGFVAVQRERGRSAEVIDVIGDELGGPYEGVLILYVLQHIDRSLLGSVLSKLARALRPGAPLLLTFQEGDEAFTEHTKSGDYHSTQWLPEAFREKLDAAGLRSEWEQATSDEEGAWRVILARRVGS